MEYAGGKNGAGVYQRIINQIPPHRVYIEAFAGSAAVYRHKLPARLSYLIDIDPSVDLEEAAGLPRGPQRHNRRLPRASVDSPKDPRAASGAPADAGSARRVYRCGPAAPLGKQTEQHVVICVRADARSFLRDYAWRGDEFVYMDPPYLGETRRGRYRRIYTCELMARVQHRNLLLIAQRIHAPVMISSYPNSLYDSILKGWRRIEFETSTRGGRAVETLWCNYPEPVELQDYRYLGENFRQRQDFKRMRERWTRRLAVMPALKRQALLAALRDF